MIGLALSGGGSRAMAFHLGCLRALNDLDILDRIGVLSTISGGSVMSDESGRTGFRSGRRQFMRRAGALGLAQGPGDGSGCRRGGPGLGRRAAR